MLGNTWFIEVLKLEMDYMLFKPNSYMPDLPNIFKIAATKFCKWHICLLI